MDSKEPEYEKHDSSPHAGGARDNQNRHAVFHVVTCALRKDSRQPLEKRDQQRENPQRSERPEPDQGESPKRL
jgi:hypothetical protein